MTNFEFHKIYSLLGKKVGNPDSNAFFECIHREYKDFFIVHEPLKVDFENENDNWKCYDSRELGLVIEIVGDIVASISFSSGIPLFDQPSETPGYSYLLLGDLNFKTNREGIRKIFGNPKKEGDFFDQYQIDEKITMGILYNLKTGSTNTVSYGLTELFSNPEKIPNRLSFIFMSLS